MRPDDSGFADLLNGLTLDGGGKRGRSRRDRAEPPAETPPARSDPVGDAREEEASEIVRAYAWTAGRTRPDSHLEVETLVSAAQAPAHHLPAEHHTVVELCRSTRSVAEVAALLSLPLGVVKVLVADLAARGLLVVHRTDAAPDIGLMERVLGGLRRL